MRKLGAILLSCSLIPIIQATASPEQDYAPPDRSPSKIHVVKSVKLTLNEAINKALENSYELRAKKRLLKVKMYERNAAYGYLFPEIKLSAMYMSTNNPGWGAFMKVQQKDTSMKIFGKYMDLRDAKVNLQLPNLFFGTAIEKIPIFGDFLGDIIPDFQQGYEIIKAAPTYPRTNDFVPKVELQQPLYAGGKILTGIRIRTKAYKAVKDEVHRQEEKVIYDVSKAYYGALLAKNAIKLAYQAFKSAEKHYKTAVQMHENGLVVFADVLRAKVFMQDVKSKITEAENNYLIAKRGLLLAMGVDDTDPRDIDIIGELICEPVKQRVDYFQDYAMLHRADLLAMRKKVSIAKDMIKMKMANFKPEVGLFYNYETHSVDFGKIDRNTGYSTYGIAANWTIFKGFQNVNNYKAAKEAYKQYRTGQKGFEEFIKFSVYKAYEQMLIQRQKVKTAQENMNYAKEVLKITENSYKNQLASMIDLIDTQTMYDKIKFDFLHANYNCQLAVLELKYQSGMLMEGIR